jgi:hypothetical protein
LKKKIIIFNIFIIAIFLIPSTIAVQEENTINTNDEEQYALNNLAVQIIRPKPSHLYLFDTFEIPISYPSTIIIGDITCVAEQVPVYPYTVKWIFTDWQYGVHKYPCDNVSTPYWRYTYSNFNFGQFEITASFENTAETVLTSDTIIVKKYL